jgi:transcription antitermination factor NusG
MKYIKLFEQLRGRQLRMPTVPIYKRILNYKVGDYVEFIDDVFGNKKIGKIIEITPSPSADFYRIELPNKETATSKKYITRKLTQQEIDIFELEEASKKYNI